MGKSDEILIENDDEIFEENEIQEKLTIADETVNDGTLAETLTLNKQEDSNLIFRKRRSTIQNLKNKIIPMDIDTDMLDGQGRRNSILSDKTEKKSQSLTTETNFKVEEENDSSQKLSPINSSNSL